MIDRLLLIPLVCLFGTLAGCGATPEPSLHAVGVYEGADEAEKVDGKTQVYVNVDLPGEQATLILTSYDPVAWNLKVSHQTRLERIILGGREAASSIVMVNDRAFDAVSRDSSIPYTYRQSGEKFRAIVEHVPKTLGFERLSSFRGKYDAPITGFSITKPMEPNPKLDPGYLSQYLPDLTHLANLRFKTILGGIPGVYGADMQLIEEIDHIDTGANVRVAKSNLHFQLKDETLIFQNGKDETPLPISPPEDLLSFWRPNWIYWNQNELKLIVSSRVSWAQNYMFEYDPTSDTWAMIADFQRTEVHSIFVDPETGRRTVALGRTGRGPLRLAYLNKHGDIVEIDKFGMEDLPGLTDLYDVGNSSPPGFNVEFADGRHIMFSTNGKNRDFDRDDRLSGVRQRIYLYDTQLAKLDLIYYRGMTPR